MKLVWDILSLVRVQLLYQVVKLKGLNWPVNCKERQLVRLYLSWMNRQLVSILMMSEN